MVALEHEGVKVGCHIDGGGGADGGGGGGGGGGSGWARGGDDGVKRTKHGKKNALVLSASKSIYCYNCSDNEDCQKHHEGSIDSFTAA